MSKKLAIFIVSFLVILVAGGFLAFYFYTNRGTGTTVTTIQTPSSIFPENSGGTPSSNAGSNVNSTSTIINQNKNDFREQPALKELSQRPSAGSVAIATTSPVVLVNFIERGTGNIFQVSPENDGEVRLSNTTIPRIEEALWNKTGSQVIARYTTPEEADSIKSYSGFVLPKSAEHPDGALQGYFLSENIRAMVKNPDQNKIFYLLPNSSGSTGIIADFDGAKRSQIFDSLLQEWNLDWSAPDTIALTSKPASGIPGYLFLLNTKTGGLTRAMAGINGLTAKVNPTGATAVYSESTGQQLALKIYSLKKATTLETPIATFADKCVWSKNDPETFYCSVPSYIPPGNYPDDWYKGITSFSDEIWQVDSSTGAGKLLVSPSTVAKKDIDGTNLSLSPKEDYLLFTNKKDFHVWSLKLAK